MFMSMPSKSPAMNGLERSRRRYWLAALGVLLVAAILRALLITETPPGIIHDEVWNRANIDLIYAGHIAPYYPNGSGREALYLFAQAASVAELGENLVAMRLPSIGFGMVLVAATVALGRRMFGALVGLVAGLALATSFWAVLFSRLAVRNISLPAVLALTLYALYRALSAEEAASRTATGFFAAAGFMLGLTPYTFPGAWGLPLFIIPLIAYLALFEREPMRGRWAGLSLMLIIAVVMAAPAAAYLHGHPEMRGRAEQVNEPLLAALAGDFGPVLSNIPYVLTMFTIKGDHGLEYNVQWRPVFPEPLVSGLFYLGVILALWRLARPDDRGRLPYVLLWLASAAMLAPTIFTSDARNPSRPIGLLAVLFFFVGLGAEGIWRWLRTRRNGQRAAAALLAVTFMLNTGLTGWDLFERWPNNPVVQFLYQHDLYQIARYLDAQGQPGPATIAGLTPDWVDPMSLRLLMARRDIAPGFFDGQGALLLSGASGEGETQVLVPDMLTLHPAVKAMLAGASSAHQADGFTRWVAGPPVEIPEGYVWQSIEAYSPLATLTGVGWDSLTQGQPANLITGWQTHAASTGRLRVFIHLMDGGQSSLYAQDDGLHVPSMQWRPDEVFYQTHALDIPADLPPGEYILRIGLYEYEPDTGTRVIFEGGSDAVNLPITVR